MQGNIEELHDQHSNPTGSTGGMHSATAHGTDSEAPLASSARIKILEPKSLGTTKQHKSRNVPLKEPSTMNLPKYADLIENFTEDLETIKEAILKKDCEKTSLNLAELFNIDISHIVQIASQ